MQPLEDHSLSSVYGQDGIVIDIGVTDTMTADSVRVALDEGVVGQEASLLMENIAIVDVDVAGSVGGGSAHIVQTIDVGSDGTDPYLSYQLELHGSPDPDGGERLRLDLGELSLGGSESYGHWALDGQGLIHLTNRGGLFNGTQGSTYLLGELINGRMYHRQLDATDPNRAYLILENLYARWEMPGGSLGLTSEGLRMASDDIINVALDFDVFHKTGGTDFTPGGRGMMHFGWLGSLRDPEILWRFKGAAPQYTPYALNLSTRWNYVAEGEGDAFRWRLGETGGTATPGLGDTRNQFELTDWVPWGNRPYSHDWPLIGLDLIADNRISDSFYELCWGAPQGGGCGGGQVVSLRPGLLGANGNASGLSLIARDGSLMTYSRKINLLEHEWNPTTGQYEHPLLGNDSPTRSFDWGLIYTFANVNANISLYPGGNPDDPSRGLMADILLMSQTFSEDDPDRQGLNWDNGSHLMIADTRLNPLLPAGGTRNAMGIGLLSTSFLIMADDTRIWMKPVVGADMYSGGIDIFSPKVRFALNTTFGGGVIPDENGQYGAGPAIVLASIIDGNLEGAVNMRLSPSAENAVDGQNYLGYSWAIRLMDIQDANNPGFDSANSEWGSYLSFAEPNAPDVALRFAKVTGDISLENGRIDIRSTSENSDRPSLVAEHDLRIGNAAAARIAEVNGFPALPANQAHELRVDSLMLGDAHLGRIVIPSGQAHARFMLEPQLPSSP